MTHHVNTLTGAIIGSAIEVQRALTQSWRMEGGVVD